MHKGGGLLRDSNGNCIGQTTNEYATMASFPFVQQSYDIENKLYYSGQSLRFPLAEANNSLLGIASVFSEDGICYNQGALAATFYPNLVTSIITESEVNGVSTVSIGYMSKGYWLSVWFVQTINVVRAKLYKES
jgi:hypothetical protein